VGWVEPVDPERTFDTIDVLRKIAGERQVSPAQVAVRQDYCDADRVKDAEEE
jgi:hypothetical protein